MENDIETSNIFGSYSKPRFSQKQVLAVVSGAVLLICLFVIGLFLATPLISIYWLKSALIEKDAETVSGYIDFPKFRESLKEQLNAKAFAASKKDSKDNPFRELGMMLAPSIINNMVDSLVTPAGIRELLSGDKKAKEQLPQASFLDQMNSDQGVDIEWAYVSFNDFQVKTTNKGTKQQCVFGFERNYLLTWKLISVQF